MLAGPLDRRIILQRAATAQDPGTGEEVSTWANIVATGDGSIAASWRRASARETLAASEVSAAVTDVFEIRYDSAWSDLSPLDRLTYNGKTYDIVEVAEIGRRVGLRVGATARAD